MVDPRFSQAAPVAVLMVTHDPDPRFLRQAIMSVRHQTVEDWELLIVCAPVADRLIEEVVDRAAHHDPRITVVDTGGHLSAPAALNEVIGGLRAPYVALLGQDDFLEPDALESVLAEVTDHPTAEIIYSDWDVVDESEVPHDGFAKPDWSPERLRGGMYIAKLTVLSTEAVRMVGGFRVEFDGAHEHDLVLRVSERGAPVRHVARAVYHCRQPAGVELGPSGSSTYSAERGRAAVQDHLGRIGIAGRVTLAPSPGCFLIERFPSPDSTASIVIPTRGGRRAISAQQHQSAREGSVVMAVDAVRSIVARDYVTDYEIIVVHDSDADRAYLADLRGIAGDRLHVVESSGPFNFSAKVNQGVAVSTGDVVVLLNDDVEVIADNWLDQLVAHALQADVGAVGSKLLYEDGTIQHAGLYYLNGMVGHIAAGEADGPGVFGQNVVDREVTGATAACLAVRRVVWERLGGMDESLPNSFNDVDFCSRVRAMGYRIVQANTVCLHHFESKTRRSGAREWEVRRILSRLSADLAKDDPFTRLSPTFDVASDSRSAREWMRVSREVLAAEGPGSFVRKAARRVTGRRPDTAEASGTAEH